MKQSEAIKHLRILMAAVQNARSVTLENLKRDGISKDKAERLLAGMEPWMFGPKNILVFLDKILSKVDAGASLEPMEFYNIVVIATINEPILRTYANVHGTFMAGVHYYFPEEPDIYWMKGWEPEVQNENN